MTRDALRLDSKRLESILYEKIAGLDSLGQDRYPCMRFRKHR